MSQQIKQGPVSVVVPELHFFQIKGEFLFRDPMVFDESLFSITPETFHTVDVDLAGGKPFFMVDFKMPIATEHERVVASEFIGIDDGTSSDGLDREIQKRLSPDILDDLYFNDPVSFQDAEYRDFVGRTTPSLTLSPATEVGLIELNFTLEKIPGITPARDDRQPDHVRCFEHRGITQTRLLRDLPRRQFQFKEFEDPQPVLERNPQAVDPPTGEVMKRIFTALASEPFADDSVDGIASTSTAETTVVFPT